MDPTYETDGISKKFLEQCPAYNPTLQNLYIMISWILQRHLGVDTGAMESQQIVPLLHRHHLWTVENLWEAYRHLSSKGLLETGPWKPLDKRPLAKARKQIKQLDIQAAVAILEPGSSVTKKSIEEVLVACEAEMHLHYFMEAQECLKRAESAATLDEALLLAADGLIALDRSVDCGAPKSKTLELEKKLKEVSLGKLEGARK